MFTGLIEDLGTIVAIAAARSGQGSRVTIATKIPQADLSLGASVAVDGACLTVVESGGGKFSADASVETLKRTTLGERRAGDRVNLERPLALGARLSGHLVLGHVDGVGTLVEKAPLGEGIWVVVELPAGLGPLVVEKGSIALDGISLTVNELRDAAGGATRVALLLIPWKPGPARAALHGLLFLSGLLSKEGFLAIAVVVLADDFAARRKARAAFPRWLAVAAAITAWLGLRAALQIGAIQPGPLADVPRTFLSAVSIYLARAAWPLPLTVSHPFAPLGPTGLAIGAAAVVVLLGIGLRVRSLLPAVALVLAPVAAQSLAMSRLGIAPERYFYLPSIGLAWLLAAGLARLQPLLARPRLRAMLARPPLLLLSTAAALAALGVATVATVRRLPDWRSDEALFTAAAAIDPNDALANLYLGIAAGTSGHLEEAQQRLERAKAREPDNARIANALAWALLHRGDGEAAKAEARRAVALSPGLPQARLTLASAYHLTGAHLAERVEADRAVKLSPRFREARVTRVLAFCEIDRAPACEADLDLIDREQPLLDDAFSRVVRVEAALRRGNVVSATERLEGLRAAHPGDARLAILTKARDALLRRPGGKK